jgi:hypothetical protein
MTKPMTRRPEVGLNEKCVEIVDRAFRDYNYKDPLFRRHWVFINAIAEAYQLGVAHEHKRHNEEKPLSDKEIASFLYQASIKHLKSLSPKDVRDNGINIVTDNNSCCNEKRYVLLTDPLEIQKEMDENNPTLCCRWKTDNRWERFNAKDHFGEIWQYDWRKTK